MNIEGGSNEAKTKQPELLQAEAVADLVSGQGQKRSDAAASEALRAFMRSRQPVASVDLRALIGEGRA